MVNPAAETAKPLGENIQCFAGTTVGTLRKAFKEVQPSAETVWFGVRLDGRGTSSKLIAFAAALRVLLGGG